MTSTLKKLNKSKYASMDPFTQAKYLLDLHQQLGTPISFQNAFKEALEIAKENDDDLKKYGLKKLSENFS